MAVTVQLNGISYEIPEPGDDGWGQDLTDYFVAIASGLLQKSGGSFTLTAEVDFGNTYGLKSVYYKSRAANPASAGQVRLGNGEIIMWRNAANNADIPLSVNSSDELEFNGVPLDANAITQLTGNVTAMGPGSAVATIAAGSIVNSMISASAAIAYSKLALTGSIVNADISASAAIAFSKLAALTSGNILVGNGSNVATSVAMSGEATIANTGAVTLSNAAVIAKVLTGFSAGAGTVTSSDSILQALQKIVGNATAAAYAAPTVQRFTSGSGTYTTPSSPRTPLYIKVKMVGGGGGGSGGTSAGGNGGDSTFGTSLLTAKGGSGSASSANGALPGAGGVAGTVNSPAITVVNVPGGAGAAGSRSATLDSAGMGGGTYFGGAGLYSNNVGAAGATNSGGGGAGGLNSGSGGGGGGGNYVEAIIASPGASYAYSVGTAGTAGTNAGAGAAGIIIVEEYYQ